jgi:tetratricopeptide (TPR) repeat protein
MFDHRILKAMKKTTLIFLVLSFLLWGQAFWAFRASGEVSMDSKEVEQIIFQGLDYLHNEEVFKAVDEFKKLIDLLPNDPIGYFYVAASLQTMMDDYRNYSYFNEFNKYMDLAIEKAELKKKQGNLTAYDYLYLGGAIGYRGINEALTGDWYHAFVDGLKGKGYLEKALKLDPELYDVYYGLGTYHFWKSLKTKIFWWLPFAKDNRQMGINMIKLAIEKGKYSPDDAKLALVRIYVENKEYEKAFAMISQLRKTQPNKPFLLWFLGRAQLETKMYDGAINTYQTLLKTLVASPYYHPEGEVECRYYLALAYFKNKNYQNCQTQIDSILSFQDKAQENKNIKDFIEKAKDLRKKIKKDST